ncbi:type II toxin-antitoxin system RelE/ParE family toxin [Nanoarchaeota archaeon]
MFKAKYTKQAKDFLRKSDAALARRINKRIRQLCVNPFPGKVKRFAGSNGKVFRIRIGDYRILYEIYYEDKILLIHKIEKRSKAYQF